MQVHNVNSKIVYPFPKFNKKQPHARNPNGKNLVSFCVFFATTKPKGAVALPSGQNIKNLPPLNNRNKTTENWCKNDFKG